MIPVDHLSEEWMSLGHAAEVLGVHPSTLRSWADQGHLPSHRTQGGHRRFRRADIEAQMRSDQGAAPPESAWVFQNILRTARLQIGEGRLEKEAWYHKLDDDARHQYRLSGRSLVQGLLSHLGSTADGGPNSENMRAEARSLGYEYASRGMRCGLSSVEAAHAFLFFRTMVMDTVLNAYEASGVRSAQVWSEMFRNITSFGDMIMITLLETYEAFQRGTGK
jgi:excisionase family DNA binding protein